MRIVLDASVAVKLVHQEADSREADRVVASAESIAAPDFLFVELANVLLKVARLGAFDPAQVESALGSVAQVVDVCSPTSDLLDDAIAIARLLRHPVYDCVYLALGRRLDAPVLTADAELVRACDKVREWAGAAILLSRASSTP